MNKKLRTVVIVAIIAVLVLILLFINNNPHLILSSIKLFNKDYETPSINFEKSDYYGFGRNDDNTIVAYGDGIKAYDDKLNLSWEKNILGTNPIVKTTGENVGVFYGIEKKAFIKTKDNTFDINTDYKILNLDINEEGYFALITEENGFKSQVIVYDNLGKEIYAWHSADYYIASVSISKDSKSMAVNAIDTSKEKATSKIMMFSFTDNAPFATYEENDTLILDVKFIEKKKVLYIGNEKTGVINTDGVSLWQENYTGKQLFSYNMQDGHIILALGNTASATETVFVKMFSPTGKLQGEYINNGEIIGIDSQNDGILVYGKRNLVVISENGKVKRGLELNVDIKNAFLFNDEKTVFVISNSAGKIYYLR